MYKRRASTLLVTLLVMLALAVIPASAAQEPGGLAGQTTFAGVFTESGFVFSPADVNFCDATATVVQEDGGTLVLEVAECGGFRTCTWQFTIGEGGEAEGGQVSCSQGYETGSLVSDIELHTGCKVGTGSFPVYQGSWDGSTLDVSGDFSGPCDGGTYWGDASFWDPSEGWPGVDDPEGYLDDGVTAEDGPAQVAFGLHLSETTDVQALPETGGASIPVQAVLMGLGGLVVLGGLGAQWRRP